MVQLVRADSVLKGKIELGAIIVSIDDVDCRRATSGEFTRIMMKKREFKRKIVFEKARMRNEGGWAFSGKREKD